MEDDPESAYASMGAHLSQLNAQAANFVGQKKSAKGSEMFNKENYSYASNANPFTSTQKQALQSLNKQIYNLNQNSRYLGKRTQSTNKFQRQAHQPSHQQHSYYNNHQQQQQQLPYQQQPHFQQQQHYQQKQHHQ